jgi:hypothetical protein
MPIIVNREERKLSLLAKDSTGRCLPTNIDEIVLAFNRGYKSCSVCNWQWLNPPDENEDYGELIMSELITRGFDATDIKDIVKIDCGYSEYTIRLIFN